jgi:hypothetical protein
MAGKGARDFTVLLRRVREGEEDSAGRLYAELVRRMAKARLAERLGSAD